MSIYHFLDVIDFCGWLQLPRPQFFVPVARFCQHHGCLGSGCNKFHWITHKQLPSQFANVQWKKLFPCRFPENTTECAHRLQPNHWHFVTKKSARNHTCEIAGEIFFAHDLRVFLSGLLVCVNGAKFVVFANTNPLRSAKTQVCVCMVFQPAIKMSSKMLDSEPSDLRVWNYIYMCKKNNWNHRCSHQKNVVTQNPDIYPANWGFDQFISQPWTCHMCWPCHWTWII